MSRASARLVQASTAEHVVGFGYDALGRIVEDIQGDFSSSGETFAGGATQYRFKDFDPSWITSTTRIGP